MRKINIGEAIHLVISGVLGIFLICMSKEYISKWLSGPTLKVGDHFFQITVAIIGIYLTSKLLILIGPCNCGKSKPNDEE